MRTTDEIVGLYRQRKDAQMPAIGRMAEARDMYQGDISLGLNCC